jgi:hypothetical protein
MRLSNCDRVQRRTNQDRQNDLALAKIYSELRKHLPMVLVDIVNAYAQSFQGVEVFNTSLDQHPDEVTWVMRVNDTKLLVAQGAKRTWVDSVHPTIALCYSNTLIAVALSDKSIWLLDFVNLKNGRNLFVGQEHFQSLVFAGNKLATACNDGNVYLFNAHTGVLETTLKEHNHCVCSVVALSETKIASGSPQSNDRTTNDIIVWDLGAHTAILTIRLPVWWVMDLMALPGEKILSLTDKLRVWNKLGECERAISIPELITHMVLLADGTLATFCDRMMVWDLFTGHCIMKIQMEAVSSMCVFGQTLVIGHENGFISHWV